MIKMVKIRNGEVHWLDEHNQRRQSRCGTINTHAAKTGGRWSMIKDAMDAFFAQFKKGDCVLYCGELHLVLQPPYSLRHGSVPLKTARLSDGEAHTIEDFECCVLTDSRIISSWSEFAKLVEQALCDPYGDPGIDLMEMCK